MSFAKAPSSRTFILLFTYPAAAAHCCTHRVQHQEDQEAAVALIVNGFAREVLQQLPMEFAVEAQKLLGISLEGSVG